MSDAPSLQQLQQIFKQHLMFQDAGIVPWVSDNGISRDTRLAIYANAYRSRLIEALATDYPALLRVLGEEAFYSLGHTYIDQHPSRFYTLRLFGQYLAAFIGQYPALQQSPYLQQLARLEWTFVDAFDATDTELLREADVAAVAPASWPCLSIRLHPSVHCFDYDYNVLPVWKAATTEESCCSGAHDQGKAWDPPVWVKLESAETCVIWRHKLRTQYRTMERDEAVVLKAVVRGENFSQLCEHLMDYHETPEQVPLRAAGLLKSWLSVGMLVGLDYESGVSS